MMILHPRLLEPYTVSQSNHIEIALSILANRSHFFAISTFSITTGGDSIIAE
jgi:hypothetical protein